MGLIDTGDRSEADAPVPSAVPSSAAPLPSPPPGPFADGVLTDPELQREIELVADLLVAAAAEPSTMTPAQIDRALGLGGDTARPGPPALPTQRRGPIEGGH